METVLIGEHRLPVVPQRHARLRHQLSPDDFRALMTMQYGHETYRVLGILIPELHRLIPEWEWEGYGSEEQWRSQEYVEELDRSPTTEEIVLAFEKALMVSGAGRLGKIIDLITTAGKLTTQEQERTEQQTTQTAVSPALPGDAGESA